MATLKDIVWMSSPLCYEKRIGWTEKAQRYAPAFGNVLNPRTEYRWLQKIKHWTLLVDEKCYELWAKGNKTILDKDFLCEPQHIPHDEWRETRDKAGIDPVKRTVGKTRLSHPEITVKVEQIWDEFNDTQYGFLTQNCQNFARQLYIAIAAPQDDPDIPEEEKSTWHSIPDPAVYLLETVSEGSLAAQMVRTAQAAYLAALPAAETAAGAGTVGVAATSVSASATGGAAAGSVGTAQGAEAAIGTTQTVVAGSTQPSAVMAAGGAKGTTAGGTVAGKTGLAAKFSAIGHSASAAKIGTVAKAVALHHPVSGAAMIGVTIILHMKRVRDAKYSHKLAEGVTVGHLLEMEDQIVHEGQQGIDEELDEDMAEVLGGTGTPAGPEAV